MSYDIYLIDPETKKVLHSDRVHEIKGGTYASDGTTELFLNITYNYSPFFYKTLGEKGIRTIYGMTGRQSIPILQSAVDQLQNDNEGDYWKPTEGNARRALLDLIKLANMRPDGIWEGD